MEMNFCRRCGAPLEAADTTGQQYGCSNGHPIHRNPIIGVGVFFVSPDNTKVLLSTRGREPRKGMLDALGGFVEVGETLEEAVQRELHEEVNLTPEDYGPITYLTSGYDVYPYKGENIQYVAPLYWTRLRRDIPLHAADDVASADWYNLTTPPLDRLHGNDIRAGIIELQKVLLQKEKA